MLVTIYILFYQTSIVILEHAQLEKNAQLLEMQPQWINHLHHQKNIGDKKNVKKICTMFLAVLLFTGCAADNKKDITTETTKLPVNMDEEESWTIEKEITAHSRKKILEFFILADIMKKMVRWQ